MPFIKQDPHPFTRKGIEVLDPGQIGVYGIMDHSGSMLYVGKGDIRERLLEDVWNNRCVKTMGAALYVADVLHTDPDELAKELIREYDPPCNHKVG